MKQNELKIKSKLLGNETEGGSDSEDEDSAEKEMEKRRQAFLKSTNDTDFTVVQNKKKRKEISPGKSAEKSDNKSANSSKKFNFQFKKIKK